MMIPIITGRSVLMIAVTASLPMPFQLKINSVNTNAPSKEPSHLFEWITNGAVVFSQAWLNRSIVFRTPFAFATRMCCWLITSRNSRRLCLMINAIGCSESTIAGRSKFFQLMYSPSNGSILYKPPVIFKPVNL